MPIVGLTDKPQDSSILGRIEISVFKGGKKSERSAGSDLKNKLRITSTNKAIAPILKQYSTPDVNGDYLTESINIYLPFDEVERTFNCSMKAHSASGLEVVCDRHTISKRCVPTKDAKGNTWRPLIDVEDPCPMRGAGFVGDCPNKCVKEGQFYFYIRELLDRDLMLAARLTVHGFEDITYLNAKLEEYKQLIGSLTRSPFPAHQYRHKIPFILSRTEVKIKRPLLENNLRNGKKTSGTTWALSLTIDPEWMELYRRWQLMEELRFRQLPVSNRAVLGLLTGDTSVIDAEIITESVTPPALALTCAERSRGSAAEALPSRADRMRSRIQELASQYEKLTDKEFLLPDLYAMSEETLGLYGTELKANVDRLRNI